jgi:hypothetical protein
MNNSMSNSNSKVGLAQQNLRNPRMNQSNNYNNNNISHHHHHHHQQRSQSGGRHHRHHSKQGEKIQSLKNQIEKQMKAYVKQEEYEEMLKLIKVSWL